MAEHEAAAGNVLGEQISIRAGGGRIIPDFCGQWAPTADANHYRFSSKEAHAASGLYYYGFRFYDPALQRWLNPDPLGEAGGMNLYGFVWNSPLTYADPYGLLFGDLFDRAGQWVYNQMMGDTPGQYNPDSYGAQRADLLGGIDRDDNVLKDVLGEAGRLFGDQGTDAALGWGLGRLAGVAGELGGPLWDKAKRLKCLKKGAKSAEELLRAADKVGHNALKTGAMLEDDLAAAATRASNSTGPGSGGAHGTRVHSAFETEVGALGNPNLSSEVSYLNGARVNYGTPGSVRLDVMNGPLNEPVSVFDLKTGGARLTPARIDQIQSHVPGGANVPVIQVRP